MQCGKLKACCTAFDGRVLRTVRLEGAEVIHRQIVSYERMSQSRRIRSVLGENVTKTLMINGRLASSRNPQFKFHGDCIK